VFYFRRAPFPYKPAPLWNFRFLKFSVFRFFGFSENEIFSSKKGKSQMPPRQQKFTPNEVVAAARAYARRIGPHALREQAMPQSSQPSMLAFVLAHGFCSFG